MLPPVLLKHEMQSRKFILNSVTLKADQTPNHNPTVCNAQSQDLQLWKVIAAATISSFVAHCEVNNRKTLMLQTKPP